MNGFRPTLLAVFAGVPFPMDVKVVVEIWYALFLLVGMVASEGTVWRPIPCPLHLPSPAAINVVYVSV